MNRSASMVMALLLGMTIGASAAEALPTVDDAALEARVDGLATQLRCLVCQNQSLADSHAGLAIDLKNQVSEQLRAGRNEAQVIDYMTNRYGASCSTSRHSGPGLRCCGWGRRCLRCLGGCSLGAHWQAPD